MADNLSRAQRSYCMSRVKSRGTDLEVSVTRLITRRRLRFDVHDRTLPGTPDIVFRHAKMAVFIDGDFWHGWRYPAWRHKVSAFWRKKIETNRRRDRRAHALLRRMGWKVIRIWQHDIKADVEGCVDRIVAAVRDAAGQAKANEIKTTSK